MRLIFTYLFSFFAFAATAQKQMHATAKGITVTAQKNGKAMSAGITAGTPNTFNFTLPDSATTSAGVYRVEGGDSVMVKTLWSAERYGPGTYTVQWDGLFDDRTIPPAGNYVAKVLSQNVVYSWDGARIGSTSTNLTGDQIFQGFQPALCVATTGNRLYYGNGFHEKHNTVNYVDLNNIGVRQRVIQDDGGTNMVTRLVVTDGNYVYWGGHYHESNFVFATRVSDNTKVNFSNGVTVPTAYTSYSAISHAFQGLNEPENSISSIAVQKNRPYFFSVRPSLNQLRIENKSTGAFVSNITIANIRYIATDTSNGLWVATTNAVTKYTVNNTNGTITNTGITLAGITTPAAMAVSPNNATVIVADAGINQQVVRGYGNMEGGASTWTLGTPGGYMNDATVTDYKFYFQDIRELTPVSLAFNEDGSFWVVEIENGRIQHYAANRTFINRISYVSSNYAVAADVNNKNRVFSAFTEYAIDYTKTLDNGQNGSWTLAKNWGAKIPWEDFGQGKMYDVTTIGGRTFGFVQGTKTMYELVNGGAARKTKHSLNAYGFDRFGSLIEPVIQGVGFSSTWNVYGFNGFDADNDPKWTVTKIKTLTSPVYVPNDALYGQMHFEGNKGFSFQGNRVSDNYSYTTLDYHFTGFNTTNGKRLFNTSPGTNLDYVGEYPKKGQFDNGNGVQHAGGFSGILGDNFFWTYHGEFWKQVQTNYFSHYHISGLLAGVFGTDKSAGLSDVVGFYGGAGNALTGAFVQDTPDRIFVYHGDENTHGGIHRWRIEGLNTIKIQVCAFNPTLNYSRQEPSLVAGLQHGSLLTTGNGWTNSNTSSYYPGGYVEGWYTGIGRFTASKDGDQDVFAYLAGPQSTRIITRDLGSNTGLNNWKFSANVNYSLSNHTAPDGSSGSFIEILDNAGKIISLFYVRQPELGNPRLHIRGNEVLMHEWLDNPDWYPIIQKTQPFSVSNQNGSLVFKYATYTTTVSNVYEVGADITKPTTLRLRFYQTYRIQAISISDMRFTK